MANDPKLSAWLALRSFGFSGWFFGGMVNSIVNNVQLYEGARNRRTLSHHKTVCDKKSTADKNCDNDKCAE